MSATTIEQAARTPQPPAADGRDWELAHTRGRLTQLAHSQARTLRAEGEKLTPELLRDAILLEVGRATPRSKYLVRGVSDADAERLIAEVASDYFAEDAAKADGAERESQATLLVKLAIDAGVELFHDGDSAYASVPVGDHIETVPLPSRAARRWLTGLFFGRTQKASNAEALRAGLDTLAAMARFKGEERRVFLRAASYDGSKLFVDLCDPGWRVIEIDRDGWRVIESKDAPVRFRRAPGMLPLPEPERGGAIEELRPFLNVADESDWKLVLAWLLSTFRDKGPYPILALSGEQGSAKSTTARILRDLIDPNVAAIRAEPREVRDLAIAANNGWIAAFDNLSNISVWLSDALCRVSTGGGFATRELYTDADEVIFDAQRPIILNGISEIVTRGDLLDRSILVNLPPIPESARQPEADFYARFYAARPRILSALLDAVAAALRNRASIKLKFLPRMADFAAWVMAAEPALGWGRGDFMVTYAGNRAAAIEAVIEATPIGPVIESIGDFNGTASELLALLNTGASEQTQKLRSWPKTPRGVAGALRRIAPALRAVGVTVEFVRSGTERQIQIITTAGATNGCKQPSQPSQPSQRQQNQGFFNDGRGALVTVDDGTVTEHPAQPSQEKHRNLKANDGNDGNDGQKQSPAGGRLVL